MPTSYSLPTIHATEALFPIFLSNPVMIYLWRKDVSRKRTLVGIARED
jgi:hypothetical protein